MILSELTVGYVAGFIAAAIFVARIWSPNVLTFILSAILKDTNTAATWTAASTALQRSHWPLVLQSDSARNHGVRKDVLSLTWIISFMSFIIAIAGVVTPLGLHQELVASPNTQTPFRYLKDTSPFGFGTPPRSNYSLNRRCSGGGIMPDIPCPFTDSIVLATGDDQRGNFNYPWGYNLSIPQGLVDVYSSGTDSKTTISNYFDIEWRRYGTNYDPKGMYNNGSTYLVGTVRLMQSMALNDAIEPVEGLIVNTKTGGVGFRNHTIPPGFKYGVAWQEDILFVEPETECVNTNITIDYEVALTRGGINDTDFTNLVLTDRGGFSNLIQEYPRINLTDTQSDPKLHERAYKAAWMTNAYTALYYNVTNPNNGSKGSKAWQYLNSELGKQFYLPYTQSGQYDFLSLSSNFGNHLDLYSSLGAVDTSNLPPPTNPFKISSSNFSDISMICAGAGAGDYANITNIVVNCGLMRGIPQRMSPGDSRVFDGGSKWSQPIYACASTTKATIKTVHFRYNGTDDNLKSLTIDKLEDKQYNSDADKPLWGVEDTGNKYRVGAIKLLWGILSDEYANFRNVSTVRSERLYLPGFGNSFWSPGLRAFGSDNVPASDFHVGSMASAYEVDTSTSSTLSKGAVEDFSGQTNMALWAKYQQLTKSPDAAALIPNLIFTDYAAAAVVGTKGVLGSMNSAQSNIVPISVVPTESRIRYRLPFAIPAIIALLGLILMTLFALVTMVFRHHTVHELRLHLQKLSPGRIFTTFLHPEKGGMSVSSRDWSRNAGRIEIDMTGDYPFSSRGEVSQVNPEKDGREMSSEERDRFLVKPQPQAYMGSEIPPAVSPLQSPNPNAGQFSPPPPQPYYNQAPKGQRY